MRQAIALAYADALQQYLTARRRNGAHDSGHFRRPGPAPRGIDSAMPIFHGA